MEPRLLDYNRRRHCQAQARRWRIWANMTVDVLYRSSQARLVRQIGVYRSTICRDVKPYWKWVREGAPLTRVRKCMPPALCSSPHSKSRDPFGGPAKATITTVPTPG